MKKLISLIALSFCVSLSAHASLISDTINGEIQNDFGGNIDQQFSSTAVVDNNTEFTGTYTDVFNSIWNFNVDFDSDSLVLNVTGSSDWANVRMSDTFYSILKFNFTDLDWGVPVNSLALTAYSCVSTGFSCDVRELIGIDNVNILNFTNNEILIGLNGLYHGETYKFTINGGQVPVPESSSLLLLLVGLFAVMLKCSLIRKK